MIVYATTDQLTPSWLPTAPDNATSLLRYASILVAKACQLSLYDPAPVDPAAAILADATCAQVASWVALGVDPAKAGTDMPGPVKSSSILDATVARDTTAATAAMADARDGLCAIATDLLQTAGLLYVPVPVGDTQGVLPTWGIDVPRRYGYDPFGGGYGYDLDDPYPVTPPSPIVGSGLVLTELDNRFDQTDTTLANIQETLMAYTPATTDVTRISGAVILVASSATSVALTAGRAHEVTGSAAQTFTAPSSPINGTVVNVKVAEAYTGSGVTMPSGMTQAGVLTAGQDYTWQYDGTGWNIQ